MMKHLNLLLLVCLAFNSMLAQQIANTTWKTYNPNLTDTITVKIGTDTINQFDGQNSLLLSSLYSQSNDTVLVLDVGGTYMCINPDTGMYRFTITGDTMSIALIADDCFPRSVTFNGVKLWRADKPSFIPQKENSDVAFKMHPNPSSGMVVMQSKSPGILSIYNELGQNVLVKELRVASPPFTVNLNKGAYIVVFRTNNAVMRQKLLVH